MSNMKWKGLQGFQEENPDLKVLITKEDIRTKGYAPANTDDNIENAYCEFNKFLAKLETVKD